MNNITEKEMKFNELERKIYKFVCKIGCEILKYVLEWQDKKICEERDKKRYRYAKRTVTTIKTIMGEVEYKHTIYYDKEKKDDEKIVKGKKTVSLLKDKLKIKKIGMMSMNVASIIKKSITSLSYRKTAELVTDITNLNISSMGVWGLVQTYAKEIQEMEDELIEKNTKEVLKKGTKNIKILYSESDGVYFNLQGKDRKKMKKKYDKMHSNNDRKKFKKELKVGIMYEENSSIGKQNRKKLVGKEVFAGVMDNKRLAELMKTYSHIKYDKIEAILQNSDGLGWTNKKIFSNVIRQLDEYHIIEKINQKVCMKEDRQNLIKMYHKEEFEEMLEYIEWLKGEYSYEETECKKLEELKEYLSNNYDTLKRIYKDKKLKEKLEIEEIDHMGHQESNNYSTITRRFKHKRMSFSIQGANNLAVILATENSDRKESVYEAINSSTLPATILESVEEYIAKIEANVRECKEKVKKQKEIYELPKGNLLNIGMFEREVEQKLRELILR